MSRRYSDAPINLIARIPTPEQISAARPKKRSFGQMVMESGATCARRIADMLAQLHRFGRSISSPMKSQLVGTVPPNSSDEPSPSTPPSSSEEVYLSNDRLARWNALLDATAPHIESDEPNREPISAQAARPKSHTVESVPLDEVLALRSELLAHQQEVARLSAQLQELKSMVGSQQQVLVYLGQEVDVPRHPMVMAAAQSAPPAKKGRVMRAKPVGKELPPARKSAYEPFLNL